MRMLLLGGTGWLGGEIAAAALARRHTVTCVARGDRVPAGVDLVRADRNDDRALTPVMGQWWDVVVDVASQPGHVRRAVRDLRLTAGRFIYVSTVSVYAANNKPGADETDQRLPALASDQFDSMAEYGHAKVACEDHVIRGLDAGDLTIVRPGLIGGPGDTSWRSVYWPWRFAHPSNPNGDVLVPQEPGLHTAIIDVRDLAAWIVDGAERRISGIYNAQGATRSFAAYLQAAATVGGRGVGLEVPGGWLTAHEVNPWMGPRSLPLWLNDSDLFALSAKSSLRATKAGLRTRPIETTLRDALAWAEDQPVDAARGSGLTDVEECALVDLIRTAGAKEDPNGNSRTTT